MLDRIFTSTITLIALTKKTHVRQAFLQEFRQAFTAAFLLQTDDEEK